MTFYEQLVIELKKHIVPNDLDFGVLFTNEKENNVTEQIKQEGNKTMDRKRIYSVEFFHYIDNGYAVWSKETGKYLNTKDLLIEESDIEHYNKIGKGIKKLAFVGYLDVKK